MKVFYDERQSLPLNIKLRSPSPNKPLVVVKRWLETRPVSLQTFDPVSRDDFKLAHEAQFVDDILDCKRDNGFDTRHSEVATTLPWTTGSFYAATRYALLNKTIACSPTSGFHHAEYSEAMGFCTFNGLMVAAIKLHQEFPDLRLGILDCDHHYGNGTDSIIQARGCNYIRHYTFGGEEKNHYLWNGGWAAKDWLVRLPYILFNYFNSCDLILYQAGADPHREDPHGGAMTTEQLAERDQIVFDFFSKSRTPVAWNLAGGYQQPLEKVLQIHDATLDAALAVLPTYV